jgi:Flp pilus assembly protein TadD
MWLSQRHIDAASAAFLDGDCRQTTSDALAAISVLGNRPEPYAALGSCDILDHRPKVALTMVHKAISLDPGDWTYRYELAIIQASAGLDPMPAARAALRLDPTGALVRAAWKTFRGSRSGWTAEGFQLVQGLDTF